MGEPLWAVNSHTQEAQPSFPKRNTASLCAFASTVVKHFAPQGWTVVTWDYRGLFESDAPKQQRRLAVPEHAEDVREMLDAIGGSTIDVFVGWSTGVQVPNSVRPTNQPASQPVATKRMQ